MSIHKTTAGRVKVGFALDPETYTLLQAMATGPRGVGTLLDDLIRAEAARRTTSAAPASADRKKAFRKMAHRLVQQSERLRLLHRIDRAILSAQSPAEIAEAASQGVLQATGAIRVAVALWCPAEETLEILAVAGHANDTITPGAEITLEQWPWYRAVSQGERVVEEDLTQQPDASPEGMAAAAQGIRSRVIIPLMVGGRAIGHLALSSYRAGAWPAEDIELAQQIADSLAVAVNHARLLAEVQQSRRQLRDLSHHLVDLQEDERKRLSQELHDRSGQSTTALKLGLGLLRREAMSAPATTPELLDRIDALRELADVTTQELHDLAVSLRPSALDRYGLIPALEQLLATFRKQNRTEIEFLATGLDQQRLAADVETALYRIVQEGLTNISRHSHATRAGLILSRHADRVGLILEDDGLGFDENEASLRGRLGLLGMRERAEMLGGTLTVESKPGCGTTLYIDMPMQPETSSNITDALQLSPELARLVAQESTESSQTALLPEAELARAKALSDALNDLHQVLATPRDPASILQAGLNAAVEAIGLDIGVVYHREDNTDLTVRYVWGLPPDFLSSRFTASEMPLATRSAETAEIEAASDLQADGRFDGTTARQFGYYATLTIPLKRHDGQVEWVLGLAHSGGPRAFTPAELDFARRLSTWLSLALDNAFLRQSEAYQREELEVQGEELLVQNEELVNMMHQREEAFAALRQSEQALRHSEATYRAIAQSFPNGAIYVFDRDLRFLVVEGELLAALGQSPAALEGKTIWDMFDADTVALIEPRYRRALAGEHLHFETPYDERFGNRVLTGDYRPIREDGREDAAAPVVAGLLVIRDITERAQAEETLREAAAQLEQRVAEHTAELEAIFDSLPDAVYVGNQNGITRCNRIALQTLGCTLDDLQDTVANLGAKLQNRYASSGERVPPEKEAFAIALTGRPCTYEVISRNLQTGEDVIQRCSANPVIRHGEVIGAVAINTDITAAKRTEKALRQQSARLEILHAIDRSILAAHAPSEIAQAAVEQVRQAIDARWAVAVLFDFAARSVEILAVAGDNTGYMSPRAGPALDHYTTYNGAAFEQLTVITDVAALPDTDPRRHDLLSHGVRAMMTAPLIVGDRVIGALTIAFAAPGVVTADVQELGTHVADSLALAIHHARLNEQVQANHRQLQALARRRAELSERERYDVADRLYNDAGQALTSLMLQLGALERQLGRGDAPATQLAAIKETVDDVLRTLHDLAMHLRPVSLDQLGLAAALQQYVADFARQHCLRAALDAPGMARHRAPIYVETALYRITQEALANVAQHAHATAVYIDLTRDDSAIMLCVNDNGVGFNPATAAQTGGLGLLGIAEQVESLGGRLEITSAPAKGTRVQISVPLAHLG